MYLISTYLATHLAIVFPSYQEYNESFQIVVF